MPRVTDAHRAARREEIMTAAMSVFSRYGYRGASMAMIIAESELSAGAIYSYFPSKEELFHATVEHALTLRVTNLAGRSGDRPRSPGELAATLIDSMRGLPIMEMGPQIWAEARTEPEIRRAFSTVFDEVGSYLAGELEAWGRENPDRVPGDPGAWARRIVPVVVSSMQGFAVQRLVLPGFDEQAYLDALSDAFRH